MSQKSLLPRCYKCRMHLTLCFCKHVKPLTLKTKVIVVMHWREFHLITNTGTLAHRALTNSEIRFRGHPTQSETPLKDLLDPNLNAHVLYPVSSAKTLNKNFSTTLKKPLTLIVLDGNWRQASKMMKREPILRALPKLRLQTQNPSEYHLRRNPIPGNVCTFEAIARSLGFLESSETQHQMENLLQEMVSRHLFTRGKRPKLF